MKHLVGVDQYGGVVRRRHRFPSPLRTLRKIGKRAARISTKPRDAGGDGDTIFIKQTRVQHSDEEPLWHALPICTSKLRNIGMNRQFLPRCKDIGVNDGRNDQWATCDLTGNR